MTYDISKVKSWSDVVQILVENTKNVNSQKVWMALMIASACTYIMFYTDTVEAFAGTVNETGSKILDLF